MTSGSLLAVKAEMDLHQVGCWRVLLGTLLRMKRFLLGESGHEFLLASLRSNVGLVCSVLLTFVGSAARPLWSHRWDDFLEVLLSMMQR